MSAAACDFDVGKLDPDDPDPWLALTLDRSLPIDDGAKRDFIAGSRSFSRRRLAPIARPLIFAAFAASRALRFLSPNWPNLSGPLHRMIHWGLRTFASPQANRLILRHFHIGAEILAFIRANAGPVDAPTIALRPRRLEDVEPDLFLRHDLNIYNFIIGLNASLRAQGRELEPVRAPDFSMISEDFAFETFPARRTNIIDVQTAIEAYTVLYALLLPRRHFERAVSSLQLDEVMAIYVAKILGDSYHLAFVENGHPLVPLSTFDAGRRLMMHGLDAEALHGWLRAMKSRHALIEPAQPTSRHLSGGA